MVPLSDQQGLNSGRTPKTRRKIIRNRKVATKHTRRNMVDRLLGFLMFAVIAAVIYGLRKLLPGVIDRK